MALITQEKYDYLMEAKQNDLPAFHISNDRCGLGKTKKFKVENTKLVLELRCSQQGGMWEGTHCFINI